VLELLETIGNSLICGGCLVIERDLTTNLPSAGKLSDGKVPNLIIFKVNADKYWLVHLLPYLRIFFVFHITFILNSSSRFKAEMKGSYRVIIFE
jgi:hypothetical protein